MAPTRNIPAADPGEALAAVYATLPAMRCKGLCHESCFSMAQTGVEQANIEAHTGVRLPLAHAGKPCDALTVFGSCSVYDVRPTICRLWGLTASMRCPHGCEPWGGHVSDAQAHETLAQVADIAQDPAQADHFRAAAKYLTGERS